MPKLTLLTFLLSIVTITTFAQSAYTIIGTVENIANGTLVHLMKINGNEDSTIISNHQFVFKGTLKEPTVAIIAIGNKNQHRSKVVFIENGEMKITGDSAHFRDALVEGSVSNNDYIAYKAELKKSGAEEDDYSDSLSVNTTVSFIKTHPNSYVSTAKLYLYRGVIPFKTVKLLYALMSTKIKGSSFGLKVLDYITNNKELKIGDTAPEFSLPAVNGEIVKLSTYRGKYVLVDFWASWCAPCRAENANLVKAYNRFHSKKFEILGIGLDKEDALKNAIKQDSIIWTNVFDANMYDSSIAHTYGVWEVPDNFLLDPNGKIVAINLRDYVVNELTPKLQSILGK